MQKEIDAEKDRIATLKKDAQKEVEAKKQELQTLKTQIKQAQ